MKLETIKKNKKKNIIIESMIVLSVVGCFTLTTSRAKYRSIQNIKLANGTVDFKAPDLKLAIKVSEDGETYTNQKEIPEGNYTLNTEKSKCRIPTSTLTGEDAPEAEGVSIEYTEDKINILGVTKKDTRCYVYFDKVQSQTVSLILAGIKSRTDGSYKGNTTPTFASVATGAETEENNGIFVTDDPMYGTNAKTYYWRGASTTNHVIFDNKCWRIIRINGDESIRLIYNGTPSGNTCIGNGRNTFSVIMGSNDSEKYYATTDGQYNNSSYVGWTYSLNSQRTLSGVESNAKKQTEIWYRDNISAAAKSKVDTAGKFCNDRNTKDNEQWRATGAEQYYAGYVRVYETFQPTLSCSGGDTYSLSVGAITADEVMFAGGKYGNNASYYLYNGQNYWTMSPTRWNDTHATVFFVNAHGYIENDAVHRTDTGVRPVINLRFDVTFNVGSDGTQNNPYVVQ